jgi:photosystem II stability/assembly factor-like uncharacterized protein
LARNPDTVYAGVEDAALFKSTDAGASWSELSGLRGHGSGPHWAPGAGGMCLHTIIIDPSNEDRLYTAISAAGAFRTDDGGATWTPINKGLRSNHLPDQDAEVGHCVHHIAMHPQRPQTLFMQKHWDVMRSDDGGDMWHEVSGNLRRTSLRHGRQVARVPQPQRRQRVGAAREGPAAGKLLRERAA